MDTQTRELIGLGLVAVGIFLGVSLFLGLGGPAGSLLEEGLRQLVGRGVALAPAVLIAMGIAFMIDTRCWRRVRCAWAWASARRPS